MEFNLQRQITTLKNERRSKISALKRINGERTYSKQIIQSGKIVTISSDTSTFAYGEYIQAVLFTHSGIKSFLYIEPCTKDDINLTGNKINIICVNNGHVKICKSFINMSDLYRELGTLLSDDVKNVVLSKSVEEKLITDIKNVLTLSQDINHIDIINIGDNFIQNADPLILNDFELTLTKEQLDLLISAERKVYVNVSVLILTGLLMLLLLVRSSRSVVIETTEIIKDPYVSYKLLHRGIPAVSALTDYILFKSKLDTLSGADVTTIEYKNGLLSARIENRYNITLQSLFSWGGNTDDLNLVIGPSIVAEFTGYSDRDSVIEYYKSRQIDINLLKVDLVTALNSFSDSKIKINNIENHDNGTQVVYMEFIGEHLLNEELFQILEIIKDVPMYITILQTTFDENGSSTLIKFKLIGIRNE